MNAAEEQEQPLRRGLKKGHRGRSDTEDDKDGDSVLDTDGPLDGCLPPTDGGAAINAGQVGRRRHGVGDVQARS